MDEDEQALDDEALQRRIKMRNKKGAFARLVFPTATSAAIANVLIFVADNPFVVFRAINARHQNRVITVKIIFHGCTYLR